MTYGMTFIEAVKLLAAASKFVDTREFCDYAREQLGKDWEPAYEGGYREAWSELNRACWTVGEALDIPDLEV